MEPLIIFSICCRGSKKQSHLVMERSVLGWATGLIVVVRAVGVVHLYFDDFKRLVLDDYLFVP